MKRTFLNSLLIISFFLSTSFDTNSNYLEGKFQGKKLEVLEKKVLKVREVQRVDYLDSLIKFIPIHEGTRYNPYYCVGGYKTVGCGHVLTKKDKHLKFPLSQEQVDSLVLSDILNAKRCLEANLPDEFKPNDKTFWLLVHFVFCKGIGNFNKSAFKRKILRGASLKEIEDDLKSRCFYTNPITKEKVRSEWSYKIRLGEINFLKTGSFGNMI
jgi:GH24 family phage-related lysozyme (muramidase)